MCFNGVVVVVFVCVLLLLVADAPIFLHFLSLIEFVSLTIHKMGLFERDSSTHI